MYTRATVNPDLQLYFINSGGMDFTNTFRGMDWLIREFDSHLVKDDDFLTSIKDRMISSSNDFESRFPAFFEAARRFDAQYPQWKLAEYASAVLSKRPFILDFPKFRAKIDETVGFYFRDNDVVPSKNILDDGAIPDLLFRTPYTSEKKGLRVYLYENVDEKVRASELWIRSAYVTIRKLGNTVTHDPSFHVSEPLSKAAFTLFMEIITWLDRDEVRQRYQTGRVLYRVVRNDDRNNRKGEPQP